MDEEELRLLLTVARILRSRLHEMAPAYQEDDIEALDVALAPWGPRHGPPVNQKTERYTP